MPTHTHVVLDTDKDENMSSHFNSWVTLAKNAIWVLGLVAVGAIKLNSIDNVNAVQDEKIARIQEESKIIKATIDSINNKQVDQLVMLTKLLTIVEQAKVGQSNNPQDKPTGK
jgi:hypothetical protein